MFTKTITFEDYNGLETVDTFYFNLSKAELMRMEFGKKEGMKTYLEKIVEDEDREKIMDEFEKILIASYGKKTEDGLFIKNKEITDAFVNSAAYSEILFTLITDPDEANAFVNGILPASLVAQAQSKITTAK